MLEPRVVSLLVQMMFWWELARQIQKQVKGKAVKIDKQVMREVRVEKLRQWMVDRWHKGGNHIQHREGKGSQSCSLSYLT